MVKIMKYSFFVTLIGFILWQGLISTTYAQKSDQKGYLVTAGGGPMDKDFALKLLSLSPAKNPRVLIIPHAAKILNTYLEKTQFLFANAGVKDIEVLDLSNPKQAIAMIEESDIIWMSGGGQVRLRKALEEVGVEKAILKKIKEGAVVGGTSAGASVQSSVMMASSKRNSETKALIPTLSYGLGLWPEVIIDQHFSERQRLERLEVAVKKHPHLLGIGIDESTAVLYNGGDTFEVVGKGTVTVLQAINPKADTDKIELVKVILHEGDIYEMHVN